MVDTGIHHKRWTREKAIEYMQRQPEYKNEADTYQVKGETKFRKG